MTQANLDRAQLAAIIYAFVSVALFGSGLVVILGASAFPESALSWMPNLVAISVILLAPLSWLIAPALKLSGARNQRR